MALSQKQTIVQKTVNSLLSVIVTATLMNTLVNPGVAMANSTPETKTPTAKYSMNIVATAYSSEAAQTDSTPCIPAMWKFDLCAYYATTGIEDTIAANFLPLGTKVRFPEVYGDKIFVVRDRMNAKYNGKSRIDFWMHSKPNAVKFGVKSMTMEVL